MKARTIFIISSIIIVVVIAVISVYRISFLWSMAFFGPLIILGYADILQKKQTILRNFPVIGHGRYLLESLRPEIMQYFVETDTEGRPINRIFRSLIYQRAKKVNDTSPFGTQMDVYKTGYEWMDHSIYAKKADIDKGFPRIKIGGPDCMQPYHASLLNISAMSYGALSKNAVMAMNKGAKMGNFAQNTGEGGLSEFHLKHGGDIVWQIGTGYFGCRDEAGNFAPVLFREKATLPNVRMIEVKISQGAKPGHGGILPASKNTPEIAAIRGVDPHTDVHSPPAHTAFSNPVEMMQFVKKLRDLSGGKPTGFKLCIGKKSEFEEICRAMKKTGITPDFITVDGGEGGTGAAPVEFSNSLGMPLREGLAFAYDTLCRFNLKDDIKLIASGKILSGFHIARVLALGADLCNSARAMMMAIGCIQALQCNKNTCPVGVATQDKHLMKGLNVEDKSVRISNYHHETLRSFAEMLAASGISKPSDIRREHINRRVSLIKIMNYAQLYPYERKDALQKNSPRE